jgi:hypothetical protein
MLRRTKLSATVSAQLELVETIGKLTLMHSPPQQGRGPCRSIVLYDAGLKRLHQETERIQAALTLGQHMSVLLETNMHGDMLPPSEMDYVVVVTEPHDHHVTFCHVDLDLLSPSSHLFTPCYQSQNVTLDEKSYSKLCSFLIKHSVWPLPPPPPPTNDVVEEEEEVEVE